VQDYAAKQLLYNRRFTAKGWLFHFLWADGSTSWEALQNLKESNPLEVAEYAKQHNLLNEPAFSWWAKHVLKRRRRVVQKVKTCYWQRTHKYGVRLLKTVAEALQLDKENGNQLWYEAIQKEMKNVQIAFKFLEDSESAPVGYKKIPCHIIFDVKMDFTHKARFVAGRHKTDPPATLTYSSVVSRDSMQIAFLLSALNGLDIIAADIGNACINADAREKVYFEAGDEFGPLYKGQNVVIVKALYGLKSSGAAWRAHFAETLHDLGTMIALSKLFRLKDGYAPPTRYLGAMIKRWRLVGDESPKHWGHSSEEYVKKAIANVGMELNMMGRQLCGRFSTPMTANY